jgi:phosphatidylinositol glycan class T
MLIMGPDYIASGGFDAESSFDLSVNPDRVLKEENSRHGIDSSFLYEFSVEKYNSSKPFDLGLTWKFPIIWSSRQAPLHASRFLMGSGNERGAIAILLKSTDELNDSPLGAKSASDGCELHVNIFRVVPWYIRVYYHSLQLFVDDQPKAVGAFVEKMHVFPSEDKISPGMMEMVLKLPCGVKSAALILEFDKVGLALHCFLV